MKQKVLIIGAGPAGLTAAYELLRMGGGATLLRYLRRAPAWAEYPEPSATTATVWTWADTVFSRRLRP